VKCEIFDLTLETQYCDCVIVLLNPRLAFSIRCAHGAQDTIGIRYCPELTWICTGCVKLNLDVVFITNETPCSTYANDFSFNYDNILFSICVLCRLFAAVSVNSNFYYSRFRTYQKYITYLAVVLSENYLFSLIKMYTTAVRLNYRIIVVRFNTFPKTI
jgi:hypothetical protein